ncbi:Palmitoyltransferase ZDHHC2 [Pseudoloma neurophilia]|uniref:Palmitoyltransferase n=1 Tax=Pseudoloma neurophilia TaxID=146866 RepID=A0A0R0M3U0_9MICR|nr:Palmitoyltransferase ZDHHC2 [Pseudoloma neurophilia]
MRFLGLSTAKLPSLIFFCCISYIFSIIIILIPNQAKKERLRYLTLISSQNNSDFNKQNENDIENNIKNNIDINTTMLFPLTYSIFSVITLIFYLRIVQNNETSLKIIKTVRLSGNIRDNVFLFLEQGNVKNNSLYLEPICAKCNTYQPERCTHCKYCNMCYLKRIDHCFILDTCIYFTNEKWFIQCMTYRLFLDKLTITYGINHFINTFTTKNQLFSEQKISESSVRTGIGNGKAIIFLLIFIIISVLLSFNNLYIFIKYLRLLLSNLTVSERKYLINRKKTKSNFMDLKNWQKSESVRIRKLERDYVSRMNDDFEGIRLYNETYFIKMTLFIDSLFFETDTEQPFPLEPFSGKNSENNDSMTQRNPYDMGIWSNLKIVFGPNSRNKTVYLPEDTKAIEKIFQYIRAYMAPTYETEGNGMVFRMNVYYDDS